MWNEKLVDCKISKLIQQEVAYLNISYIVVAKLVSI